VILVAGSISHASDGKGTIVKTAHDLIQEEDDKRVPVQELLLLMPSLETRVGRMNLKLLEELLQDTAGIASKLVRMKLLFPTADIYKIVQSRSISSPRNLLTG